MKASEVLKRYAAGERDFRRAILRGQSFKGEDLSEVNFSYADIRGANFTETTLISANFSQAKAGLQRRWVVLLVGISWFTSVLSGIAFGFASMNAVGTLNVEYYVKYYTVAPGVISFLILLSFLIVTCLQGLTKALLVGVASVGGTIAGILLLVMVRAIPGVIGTAVVGAVTAVVLWALPGVLAVSVAVAGAKAIDGALAGVIAGVIAWAVPVAMVFVAWALPWAGILAIALTGVLAFVGSYVGWCALNGNDKFSLIRSIAVAFTTAGGTNFRSANLTDANFTEATLKSTDFRKAILTRTNFHKTTKLDRARPGETYLRDAKSRQLVITSEGQNKNFNRLDLRGVNLQGANLENASFIDADFYQASLQGANLSRAILVRTNFERADLRSANLTGSCIQDWVITESTKLDGIICEYVFLNWVSKIENGVDKGDKRDQMPPRGKFKEGGFVTFVRYILETVELYHEKDINPRLALTVLQKMSRDYDEPLDIVALGKKGERVFIQVKVSENIQRENFKEDYYSKYDEGLKLWSGNIHQLPPTVNSFIEKRINEIASEKTDDFVFVDAKYVEGNYAEIYPGEVKMSGDKHEVHLRSNRNIHMGGGNYNERIEGDYNQNSGITQNMSGGTMYGGMQAAQGDHNNQTMDTNVVSPQQQQTLASAAAEIQQLLEQLDKTYPTDTNTGKMALATEAIAQIESNPTLTARILSALKVGSVKAFEQFLSHPAASFVIGALEDWEKTKGS